MKHENSTLVQSLNLFYRDLARWVTWLSRFVSVRFLIPCLCVSFLTHFSSHGLGEPYNESAEKSGFSVILNHSGKGHEGEGRVLKGTLVELIAGSGAGEHEGLIAVIVSPSGHDVEVPFRNTFHKGFEDAWIAHVAVAEAGVWSYRVEGDGPGDIREGEFEVFSLDDRTVPPPGERPALPYRVLYNNDGSNIQDRALIPGLVTAENAGSLAFHRRMGFHEVGRIPEAGWKFGRFHDLVLVRRALGADDAGDSGAAAG